MRFWCSSPTVLALFLPSERGAWSGGVRRRMASASTGPSRLAHPSHRYGRRAVARASAHPPRARLAPAPGRGQHDLDSGRSRVPRWNNPYGGARRRRAADALRRGLGEEVPPLTLGLVAGIGGNGDCPHECIESARPPRRRRARTNADAAHADASSVADHRARRQTHAGVAPGRATQR